MKTGENGSAGTIAFDYQQYLKDAINNNSNLQLSKVVNQGDWRAIMAIKK